MHQRAPAQAEVAADFGRAGAVELPENIDGPPAGLSRLLRQHHGGALSVDAPPSRPTRHLQKLASMQSPPRCTVELRERAKHDNLRRHVQADGESVSGKDDMQDASGKEEFRQLPHEWEHAAVMHADAPTKDHPTHLHLLQLLVVCGQPRHAIGDHGVDGLFLFRAGEVHAVCRRENERDLLTLFFLKREADERQPSAHLQSGNAEVRSSDLQGPGFEAQGKRLLGDATACRHHLLHSRCPRVKHRHWLTDLGRRQLLLEAARDLLAWGRLALAHALHAVREQYLGGLGLGQAEGGDAC
mmetsp:Transcript_173034/g.554852  ORF Transcript_173034/g.554852 Transcript_173034/m.554852 type:complete len:299 (-) Transcript_173034:199-1095(-)